MEYLVVRLLEGVKRKYYFNFKKGDCFVVKNDYTRTIGLMELFIFKSYFEDTFMIESHKVEIIGVLKNVKFKSNKRNEGLEEMLNYWIMDSKERGECYGDCYTMTIELLKKG